MQEKHDKGGELTNASQKRLRAHPICTPSWVRETFQKVLVKRTSPCWHCRQDNGAKIAETAHGIKTSLVELRQVPNHSERQKKKKKSSSESVSHT